MFKIADFLGASVLLTIIAALLYLSGSFMLYAHYYHFGIPLSLIEIDLNNLLMIGRGPLIIFLVLFTFSLIINKLLIKAKRTVIEKGYKRFAHLIPGMNSPVDILSWLGVLLMSLAIYFIALKISIDYQGAYSAKRVADESYPLIKFEHTPDLIKDTKLRLITYSNSRYFVFTSEEESDKSPSVYILEDKKVGTVNIWGMNRK